MKIGLDFDGVIADVQTLKSEAAKELFDVNILAGKFKKEILFKDKIISPLEYGRLQEEVFWNQKWISEMRPINGALKYIQHLIDDGHEIIIITSRIGAALENAKLWAANNNLQLRFYGVGYGNPKTEFCKGLDIFIDDDRDKLFPLKDVVKQSFLFDFYGQCKENMNNDGIKIIFSWKQFYEIINSKHNEEKKKY